MNNRLKRKKQNLKIILILFFSSFLIVLLILGILFVTPSGNQSREGYVYIRKNSTLEEVSSQLEAEVDLHFPRFFKLYARMVQLEDKLRPGRYAVSGSMSNMNLLKRLIRQGQDPVRVSFSSIRTQKGLVEQLTHNLAMEAEDLNSLLQDSSYCASMGFDTITIRCIFLPDSYEVYWNATPEELVAKMYQSYEAFWNAERRQKAEKIGLTLADISIVASIVEEESNKEDEYPRIAGLYINRLRRGMKLQADPTVKYALNDFSIKRITQGHTLVESPYNTYQVKGLPPGPIRFPQRSTLDAVLNCEKHPYIYMCAKSDLSGYHTFASNYADHLKNAYQYRRKLDSLGIKLNP